MTPPPFIRNFGLGSTHLEIGQADLRLAEGRLDGLLQAAREQRQASERARSTAVDQFLVTPTLRYREPTTALFRPNSTAQMESYVPILLGQARGGHRLSYFNLLQLHFGLLDRAEPANIPALSQRTADIAIEYADFLRNHPELGDVERMRALFAGARMLHTYLAYLLHPPRPLEFPERESTQNLLFSTLDSLDSELQRYHAAMRQSGIADIAEYEGVARTIELRRRLRHGSPEDRRHAALDLAQELTLHPPPEAPLESDWQSRAERAILDTPNAIERLRSFDRPASAEEMAATLNALALETLEVAAATLDQADEESESVIVNRYRDLGLVLSISILRHPESTLEELLSRLQDGSHQADFIQEISQASNNPALASALTEALRGRDAAGLAGAARRAALHVQGLRDGTGAAILPAILEENRNHHPLRRTAEALARLPLLATDLHLPQAGAIDPVIQRQQAVELLRRGNRGTAELDAFQQAHPGQSLSALRQSLDTDATLDHFSIECLDRLAAVLSGGRDHEIAALHATFTVLDRDAELGPGLRLSAATRSRAHSLVEQLGSFGFRAGRVVSHLTSSSSLLGLAAGILATEFLPTLLIARAGLSGSLALSRVSFVSRGALTWQGSALTGLGTGFGMSLVGSGLHQWERHRDGLSMHFGRDFGTSLLLNSVTFGVTLPFSWWWNRALTPRFDATTPLTPLSAGRRFLLHGGNVAIGGFTSFALGYLGRGAFTGQWQTSPEEVAENFGSILMWEAGAAGLRGIRRSVGYSAELGAFRMAEVERITGRILELNPSLSNRRTDIQNHLGREEARYPGWLDRFNGLLQGGGHVPILEGGGRNERLLLVPHVSLPPAPTAPHSPPVVIIVRGDNERPALSAGSDPETRESVAPPPPDAAEEAPEAPPSRPRSVPPLEMAESPYYFDVAADEAYGEPAGVLHLGRGQSQEGQFHWVLGREHFNFLSPEARRVLSRAHLEVRSGIDGIISIRDLSTPRMGGLGEHHGTFYRAGKAGQWLRVPSDTYMLLSGSETIGLGNSTEPVVLSFRSGPRPVESENGRIDSLISPISHPLQISLASGQHQRFNGLTLLRPGDRSLFHIGGPGNVEFEIIRSLGNQANVVQRTNAGMNPIIGETGETTRLVFFENGARQEYRLHLDDPERPAAHLPELQIDYQNTRRSFRFRATQTELVFGKNFQPDMFSARYISRRHFSLKVVAHEGQPRYLLTADSQFGIRIGNRMLRPNEATLLYSGIHQLGFWMDRNSPQAFDGPFELHLPPIEGVFPEWGTGPLLSGHDRNIPPPPPPPPPLPPPPPPPEPHWLQRFWQRYFRGRS